MADDNGFVQLKTPQFESIDQAVDYFTEQLENLKKLVVTEQAPESPEDFKLYYEQSEGRFNELGGRLSALENVFNTYLEKFKNKPSQGALTALWDFFLNP